MNSKGLENKFWAKVLSTAVYIRNREISKAILSDVTSHHHWHESIPDLRHTQEFREKCGYTNRKVKFENLDQRARAALMRR